MPIQNFQEPAPRTGQVGGGAVGTVGSVTTDAGTGAAKHGWTSKSESTPCPVARSQPGALFELSSLTHPAVSNPPICNRRRGLLARAARRRVRSPVPARGIFSLVFLYQKHATPVRRRVHLVRVSSFLEYLIKTPRLHNLMLFASVLQDASGKYRPSAARAPRLHFCRQCDGTTSHLSKIHSHEAVVGHPPSGWHPALSAAFGSSAVFTRSLVCRQMMLISVHKLIPSCRVDARRVESVAVSNRNSDR